MEMKLDNIVLAKVANVIPSMCALPSKGLSHPATSAILVPHGRVTTSHHET